MVKKVVIFGTGIQERTAIVFFSNGGYGIPYLIDNDVKMQGTRLNGIEIVSLEEHIQRGSKYRIIVCGNDETAKQKLEQIKKAKIEKYETCIDFEALMTKERFVSYSYASSNEDIILNHVTKGMSDISWIDIGCNDPIRGSVTKAFYDRGFRGINIDMDCDVVEINKKERPEDLNLNVGMSNKSGELTYYVQGVFGELNTMIPDHKIENAQERKAKIETLKAVCEQYVAADKEITFLKIDVEGMEKEVLEGADFEHYRPKIVVMESTLPCTDIPSHEEWEWLLTDAGYHLAYTHDINRYYVANEHSDLDEKFIPFDQIVSQYCILHVDLFGI